MLRLREVLQMEKITSSSRQGKSRVLAGSSNFWQRGIHQTNTLQDVVQRQ